jgi:hypothetical protein
MGRKKKAEQLSIPGAEGAASPVTVSVSGELASALIEPTRAGAEGLLPTVTALPLETQEAVDWLAAAGESARADLAALEEQRLKITKPLNDAKRAVDAFFKPGKDACLAVVECVRSRLAEFAAGKDARQDRALAAVAAGADDEATLAEAHAHGPVLPAAVVERDVPDFEVADLSLVPREFMCVDSGLVLAYIKHKREAGEAVSIPGINVFLRKEIRRAPNGGA